MTDSTIQKIARYIALLWALCIVCGAAIAICLPHVGMSAQNAFNSGLAFALIPIIVVGIIAGVIFFASVLL